GIPRLERTPSVSERSESSTSSASTILRPAFTRCFDKELGILPSAEECEAEGMFHLARIPLREVGPIPDFKSIHKHFFSRGDIRFRDQRADRHYCQVISDLGRCLSSFQTSGGTVVRRNHVYKVHNDMYNELVEFRRSQGEDLLASVSQGVKGVKGVKRPNLSSEELVELKDKVSLILASGIAYDNLPLSFCQTHAVRELLALIHPSLTPPSQSSLNVSIMRTHASATSAIRDVLTRHVLRGSFTSDSWTSKGNHRKFIGITLPATVDSDRFHPFGIATHRLGAQKYPE
ncbi:hypothetical protein BGX20_005641, partial [Mortierella sp. AD010]